MPKAAHFEWALKPSAARTSPADLFGQGETQSIAIKFHRAIHVFAEQINGAETDDFKRTRQKDAVNVVVGGKLVDISVAGKNIDAVSARLLDFLKFRNLRQLRRLVKAAIVHCSRLAVAVPADLLDTIVKLVTLAVGIVKIGVPIRSRHVAARPLLLD